MARSAKGLLGGLDMASEMRRKLGVRMAPHSNESLSYEMLSVLTDPAETLLGQSRHLELRDLGRNSLNSRKFSQNTWQKVVRKTQERVANTNLQGSGEFLGGFLGMLPRPKTTWKLNSG